MSYFACGSLSREQEDALTSVTPGDIKSLDVPTRLSLALQHAELEARKKEAFWNAVQAFATGALPILTFFGLAKFMK